MFSALFLGFILILPNVLGLSEEMQELANQLHNTCVAETGTTNDAIDNARKGDFSEDESFKCYIKCLLSQMAIIDDDTGVIDVEAMVAILPDEYQEKYAPTVRKCGSKKGANACDSAWLTHKCYYSESPKIIDVNKIIPLLESTLLIKLILQLIDGDGDIDGDSSAVFTWSKFVEYFLI